MKNFAILFILSLFSNFVFAQDLLVRNDGDILKVKVKEITPEVIKYKDFDYQDGPLISLYKEDVFMIQYENGKKHMVTQRKDLKETESKLMTSSSIDTPKESVRREDRNESQVKSNSHFVSNEAPGEGMATVYIYRPKQFLNAVNGFKVFANGYEITKIRNNRYDKIDLPAGKYVFTARNDKNARVVKTIEAGEKYYLRFGLMNGVLGSRPELILMDPEQGALDIQGMRTMKGR